jgi:hypothetical protein
MHGFVMGVGWSFPVAAGVAVARYRRLLYGRYHPETNKIDVEKRWFVLHRVFMSVGSAGTVSFVSVAFAMVGDIKAHGHAFIGILIFLQTSFQVTLGVLGTNPTTSATSALSPRIFRAVRWTHRQHGYALFALALYNIKLGIDIMVPVSGRSRGWTFVMDLYLGYVALLSVVFVALECAHWVVALQDKRRIAAFKLSNVKVQTDSVNNSCSQPKRTTAPPH